MIMADVAESGSGICLQHSKSEAAGGGSGEEDWIPELGLRDRASTKHADQQYRAWVYCTSIDFEIALPLIQAYTHLKSLQVPACTTAGNCIQITSPACFLYFSYKFTSPIGVVLERVGSTTYHSVILSVIEGQVDLSLRALPNEEPT